MGAEQDFSEHLNAPLLTRPKDPLVGKSVLITGATRFNGIGFAIAERLASEGASPLIVVGTERSQDQAPQVVGRLKQYEAEAHALTGDVTDPKSCLEMVQRSYVICGGNVDILVNNAGTNRSLIFGTETIEDWEFIMKPKTLGALLMTQAWFNIRNQDNKRGGSVIHIGSIIGRHGFYGNSIYAMANSALVGLTRTQSREMGVKGVRVNLIQPGFVEGTEMTAKMTPEEKDMLKTVSALPEILEPSDIAGMVSFLVGPSGEKITNEVFTIDCGVGSNYTAPKRMYVAGFRRIPRRLMEQVMGLIGGRGHA